MPLKLTRSSKTWGIVALIVLALIVAVCWYIRHKRKQASVTPLGASSTQALPEVTDASAEQASSAFSGNPGVTQIRSNVQPEQEAQPIFPLKLGSQGKEVEQLQIYLMKKAGGFTADNLHGELDQFTLHKMEKHLGRNQMSERNFKKRKIDQERTYKYS